LKTSKERKINKEFIQGNKLRFLWKFRVFAHLLKMLIFFSKMPLEKKDKGKTDAFSLYPRVFEIKNFD